MKYYFICSNKKLYDIYDVNLYSLGLYKSEREIPEIQQKILEHPYFCKDEKSILKQELKSYIVSGISFFCEDEQGNLLGLINFDINRNKINIIGLCVPSSNMRIGSQLINFVIGFSKISGIEQIKLTCYGSVFKFYEKNGFYISKEKIMYDSDDEDNIIKYEMKLNILGGSKNKKTIKRRTNKKTIKKSNKRITNKITNKKNI